MLNLQVTVAGGVHVVRRRRVVHVVSEHVHVALSVRQKLTHERRLDRPRARATLHKLARIVSWLIVYSPEAQVKSF
jgi:hypothetical protein